MICLSRKEVVSNMKEYMVGEEITLVVKEDINPKEPCKGCFFMDEGKCNKFNDWSCMSEERSDGKHVVFVEKGK